MINVAATGLVVSLLLFLLVASLVQKEKIRGERFFALRLRSWLDDIVLLTGNKISKSWNHFVKYILQLNWYYSVHSLLKSFLKITAAFYYYFENLFELNRQRTKKLRTEKRQISEFSHLQEVAKHKEGTALTEAQKRKLRHRKLEDRH